MANRADPDAAAIEALAQDYFIGMHEGDVESPHRVVQLDC